MSENTRTEDLVSLVLNEANEQEYGFWEGLTDLEALGVEENPIALKKQIWWIRWREDQEWWLHHRTEIGNHDATREGSYQRCGAI